MISGRLKILFLFSASWIICLCGRSPGQARISGRTVDAPVKTIASTERIPSQDPVYPRTLSGKIVEIKIQEGLLVLEEDKGSNRYQFRLDRKTRLRADRKTSLSDRKNLALGDFQPGQMVRITYWVSDKVTELRLRAGKR
jgi:hypothetical protein